MLSLHRPAGQNAHDACPAIAWYKPATHAEQLAAPASATRPGEQVTHVYSSARAAAAWYVPVPQVLQPTLPSGAVRPEGQLWHAVRDELWANVFSAHATHAAWPAAGWCWPGRHWTHTP